MPQWPTRYSGRAIVNLAAVVSATLICLTAGAAPRAVTISEPRVQVPDRETLVYRVRWFGIPIGTGWVRIRRVGPSSGGAFVITARAEANDFLMRFYPVKDTLKSLVREDMTAVWAEKNIKEGRYRAHERVDFDPIKKIALYRSYTNGSRKTVPLDGAIHDVLGAFYWFRLRYVRVGEKASTAVFADEKAWGFSVKVLRAEKLEIRNVGSFDAILAEPEARFKGVLVDRGKVGVHFTADERRIPVLIRLATRYGPATGTLDRID